MRKERAAPFYAFASALGVASEVVVLGDTVLNEMVLKPAATPVSAAETFSQKFAKRGCTVLRRHLRSYGSPRRPRIMRAHAVQTELDTNNNNNKENDFRVLFFML